MAGITIWMDGRPHPSKNAPHEIGGFTTGVWEDDVLTAYTKHMKAGVLRRNGIPTSDQATMKLRLFRHDDLLTVTARIEDRIYLTEPLYLTRIFNWLRARLSPLSVVLAFQQMKEYLQALYLIIFRERIRSWTN